LFSPFKVSPSQIAVTSSPKMSGPNSPDLNPPDFPGLRAMLESYHRQQPKPKTVPGFKNALKLIWSPSLKKASKQRCERLLQVTAGMCVSQR